METTEAGLTKEEKFMFSILGIILLVAVGFLIVWNFSNNDRQLKEENNPVSEPVTKTEKVDQGVIEDTEKVIEEVVGEDKMENVTNSVTESDTTTNINKVSNKNNNVTTNTSSNVTNQNNQNNIVANKPSSPEKPSEDNGQIVEKPEVIITWNLPTTIIKNAIEGDIITLDKNILLSDGKTAEATVEVKKLENNVYNSIDVIDNRFIAEKGTYKYYYTYNNETKEELLIVDARINNIEIRTLAKNLQYEDNEEMTMQEFTDILANSKQTNINKNNNIYEINIIRVNNNTNKIALLIDFNEKIESANTLIEGIEISSLNQTMWQENYETGELRLLLDLDKINLKEVIKVKVYYNGQEGIIELKLNVTENIKETETNQKDNTKEDDEKSDEDLKKSDTADSEDTDFQKNDDDSDEGILDEPVQNNILENENINPDLDKPLSNNDILEYNSLTQNNSLESIDNISDITLTG